MKQTCIKCVTKDECLTGAAATNPKVIAEKERNRKSGGDEVELVKWIARKLANTY